MNLDSENRKILLVEDEAIIAVSQKRKLEHYGYHVITANTGEKAVAIFKNNKAIDLILMDIDLGKGIDGAETAVIMSKVREIPILFLSTHAESDIIVNSETISSCGYVAKNSGITVLDASIKMAFKTFDAKIIEKQKNEALPGKPDSLVTSNEMFCKS